MGLANDDPWRKYERTTMGRRAAMRPWRPEDAEELARRANDRDIWRNLSATFPHPYTLDDAHAWIAYCQTTGDPPMQVAFTVDGQVAGGGGVERKSDVECRTGVVGAWLGRRYWGRLDTEGAAHVMMDYVFETFDFDRLEMRVFSWNVASRRLLTNAGFPLEALQRKSVWKDQRLIDSYLFVYLREDWEMRRAAQ
ncbi:MAG: GNAT family N-acetyltransferase [Myxococcaceae bacterium]